MIKRCNVSKKRRTSRATLPNGLPVTIYWAINCDLGLVYLDGEDYPIGEYPRSSIVSHYRKATDDV